MTNQYYKFRGDLWTLNMNYENSACVLSQSDDELTVYGTWRTNSDITGLYFYSKDVINNTRCNYTTSYDYTDVILEFKVEYGGEILRLDDKTVNPSFVIEDRSGNVYFIPYESVRVPINEPTPITETKELTQILSDGYKRTWVGNNLPEYVIEVLEVRDTNDNLLTPNTDYNLQYFVNGGAGCYVESKTYNTLKIKYTLMSINDFKYVIDFNTLKSTFVINSDGTKTIYWPYNSLPENRQTGENYVSTEPSIPISNIEYIEFPLFPPEYVDGDTPWSVVHPEKSGYCITENKDYTFSMKEITVTGGTLNNEKTPITDNSYRLCEGYDDTYYLTPRRLAHEMYKLGYTEWNDLYIGASHFYEKKGTAGNQARRENPKKVDYSAMTTVTTTGLNYAFRKWLEDYVKWFKYYESTNIVISVSCECLQMPEHWRQVLGNGEYAKTGWVPATYFYDITNQEARDYIEIVCRQCLNIVVHEGLTPILQWGEPWWWWQELYPESISIDPDNQTTKSEKYPGQPPAFYNYSTKQKFLEENEYELPVYLTSTEEYDYEVISWLREQLVDYSNFMRGIVKSYNNGLYTVLYFPPSILDVGRVPPMMQEVNFPVDAWNEGQLDFIQLEDYDWVITDNKAHNQIYDFSTKHFNISLKNTHYFGGYVQYPKDAPTQWPLIIEAMEEAVKRGIGEVYVWAGTQVRRDNIQLHDPSFTPEETYPMLNVADNQYLNVIVLDEFENQITWLDPDLIDITETNKETTCRKVSISYPLDRAPSRDGKEWYMQGNKIFVPSTLGIDNCLYVINGEYELDYWKENTVSFEAEEVLTELNNEFIALFTDNQKVTRENLTKWFGSYYTIRNIDKLESNLNTVSPGGILSLMSLLRLIEEKTERIFITEYEIQDEKIKRYLHLRDEKNIRMVANTEILDLNFNLENMTFTQDESSTYTAMTPVLSSNNTSTPAVATANNDSRTSVTATTKADAKTVYERWLNLKVEVGEYIPMICEKESDGSVKYTSYWYAPFKKEKGQLYISVGYETDNNYNYIKPPNAPPKVKSGSVNTSETNAYAIYNVLANSLLEKLNPKLEIDLSVKDIQKILKTKNEGYHIYETMHVRAPRFDYYIPCVITETKKNPHKPGNNTIKIKSDIKYLHDRKQSYITTENVITETTDKFSSIGGVLSNSEGNLNNKLVTITARLNEADTTNKPIIKQELKDIDINKYVYILKLDLINIFNTIENNMIQEGESVKEYYSIISMTNERYKLTSLMYNSLFYTYKTGKMQDSFIIHYYSNYATRFNENSPSYWFCYYYDYFNTHSSETALKITNGHLDKNLNI